MGERDNLKRKILYQVEQDIQSVHIFFCMYMGYNGNNCVHTRATLEIVVYIRTNSFG
jgi:hypothetical protein